MSSFAAYPTGLDNRVPSPKVRYGINVYKSVRGSSNDSIRKIMGLLSDRQKESIQARSKISKITRKENANRFGADLTPYTTDLEQPKKIITPPPLASVAEKTQQLENEDRPNTFRKEISI